MKQFLQRLFREHITIIRQGISLASPLKQLCLMGYPVIHQQSVNGWLILHSLVRGRNYGALRSQKPLRLIRDGEVGGSGFL